MKITKEMIEVMQAYDMGEQIEIAVKSLYSYHKNGGKTNLLHWLIGAI